MTYTKKEKAWTKYLAFKLGLTIIIFVIWGTELAAIVESLDSVNPVAAQIIVFSVVAFVVTYVVHTLDKKRI